MRGLKLQPHDNETNGEYTVSKTRRWIDATVIQCAAPCEGIGVCAVGLAVCGRLEEAMLAGALAFAGAVYARTRLRYAERAEDTTMTTIIVRTPPYGTELSDRWILSGLSATGVALLTGITPLAYGVTITLTAIIIVEVGKRSAGVYLRGAICTMPIGGAYLILIATSLVNWNGQDSWIDPLWGWIIATMCGGAIHEATNGLIHQRLAAPNPALWIAGYREHLVHTERGWESVYTRGELAPRTRCAPIGLSTWVVTENEGEAEQLQIPTPQPG